MLEQRGLHQAAGDRARSEGRLALQIASLRAHGNAASNNPHSTAEEVLYDAQRAIDGATLIGEDVLESSAGRDPLARLLLQLRGQLAQSSVFSTLMDRLLDPAPPVTPHNLPGLPLLSPPLRVLLGRVNEHHQSILKPLSSLLTLRIARMIQEKKAAELVRRGTVPTHRLQLEEEEEVAWTLHLLLIPALSRAITRSQAGPLASSTCNRLTCALSTSRCKLNGAPLWL